LARNFHSLPDCRLRAVCDVDVARLKHMKSLYPEVQLFDDYAQFLQRARVDAVIIATSVGLHWPMAKASLQAGKHTFVEKPLAAQSEHCSTLIRLAQARGLVLMAGHTFLYSPVVRRIKQIVDQGDIGDIRYISTRRLNLGLFQKDINVAWDLAPHDISIILHIMNELPLSVNCRGSTTLSPNVHDVTSMWLSFSDNRSAIIQSSWLDPRKTREMTIVGSKRMIVYDDVATLDKIRIFDARVDSPPHYDTFAEFHYAYHYGDMYVPHVKQEEPLKVECQHFLDCIRHGLNPLSGGQQALDMVRILEAASLSLERHGSAVELAEVGVENRRQVGKTIPVPRPGAKDNGRPSGNGRIEISGDRKLKRASNGKTTASDRKAQPNRAARSKVA
jgi:predicted dehydrogenase